MKSSNLLFTASWVILLIVSGAIVLVSAGSLWRGYSGAPDGLTPEYGLSQIEEQGGALATKAFRGRRVTAATWAIGYALLAIAVTWIPYRRGERWAWWALLIRWDCLSCYRLRGRLRLRQPWDSQRRRCCWHSCFLACLRECREFSHA